MRIRVIAAAVFAVSQAAPAIAGHWSTTYGDMSLPDQPRPGALRAPYPDDNGRVIGDMLIPKCAGCGPIVRGVWVESNSDNRCDSARDGSHHWGNVEFEFNGDYNSFSGSWDYCGSGGGHSWNGRLGSSRLPQQGSK